MEKSSKTGTSNNNLTRRSSRRTNSRTTGSTAAASSSSSLSKSAPITTAIIIIMTMMLLVSLLGGGHNTATRRLSSVAAFAPSSPRRFLPSSSSSSRGGGAAAAATTTSGRHLSSLAASKSTSASSASSSPRPSRGDEGAAKVGKYYSAATLRRIRGLDARNEFSTLAAKLQKTERDLHLVLTKRLASSSVAAGAGAGTDTDNAPEKEEYIEWLITGFDGSADTGATTKKENAQPAAAATKSKIVVKNSSSSSSSRTTTTTTGSGTTTGAAAATQTFATNVLFADRPDLHPNSKRAIAKMGLTSMTEIQDRTFSAASSGRDVLGRARTGTGKTVAFLLPAIERILQLGLGDADAGPPKVGILVVSPTRELATQIGDQAEKLVAFHPGMSVQVMFGGTNTGQDIKKLSSKMPTILVATPGRLLDHMQTTKIQNRRMQRGLSFGKDVMSQTPIVVLDETDRLLDMGFRKEISKILGYLPHSSERQTLLFSATIPPDLKTIMAENMNRNYIEVDCIKDGDAATHTNEQVEQSHVIIPTSSGRDVSSVIEVVRLAVERYDQPDCPAKVVVFFPTARLVNFYAEVFNEGRILDVPVLEIHSKKSQPYRTKVSEKFRNMKRGVLFTSDVSARGVDYPNVSHVIQFGIPDSREQYIHRLGRTGRGGTDGKGWLVLSEWESLFLQELKGVDIPVNEELRNMLVHSPISPESQEFVEEFRRRVREGDEVLAGSASGAYQAFLGYYLGQMKRMGMHRKEELVNIANNFASLSGFYEPPYLSKDLIGKMGLRGVAGLNVGGGRDDYGRTGSGRSHNSASSHHGHSDGRRAPKRNAGGDRRR